MVAIARYLEGTAYILYGPPMLSQALDLEEAQGRSSCSSHSVPQDEFHQHHHQPLAPTASYFWAVFRPLVDTSLEENSQPGTSTISGTSERQDLSEARPYFLTGAPRPWGCYPSDMPEPHGCIPPHLYYRVTISAPTLNESNGSQEWILPFVHRLGDGRDDAGGLTSAYYLLDELEDADDFGEFLLRRLRQLQSEDKGVSESSSSSSSPPTLSLSSQSSVAAIYASTEVLVSEQRTLAVVEQQFFSNPQLSKELQELRRHIVDTSSFTDLDTHPFPFHLVKSDLKLMLPTDDTHSI